MTDLGALLYPLLLLILLGLFFLSGRRGKKGSGEGEGPRGEPVPPTDDTDGGGDGPGPETMRPILIHLSDNLYIHSGHFMLFVAGLAAIALTMAEVRRIGEEPERILPLLLLMSIGALYGARLLYCLDFREKFHYHLRDYLMFWKGGMTLYGGGIFAFLIFVLYVRARRMDFWKIADLSAPPGVLFIFLARIGCFLTGCCYGKQCGPGFPLGVTFRDFFAVAPKNVPLYPTQPLFAVSSLLVFFFLWGRRKRKRFEGELTLLGIGLLSLVWFFIEFLRGDLRVLYELYGIPLTQNQIINAGLLAVSIGLYLHRRRVPSPSPPRPVEHP